ncbi:hypothetical protein FIU86_04365 [Roseovarius sp. THAF9]|uniref:hypothetical protein n=1 Tax=Roseovarius sp. THAF9 TaxID=2587847 RepID=UPI00126811DA|nr:hypothetical protein [Roseovarius sp. THAF9]QFT92065.1 hypothetical protein FIU86_04365 [Roseovarius sp. THAF9]
MFKILNPVRHWQRGKATRAVLANTPVVRTGYRFPTAQSYAEDVAQDAIWGNGHASRPIFAFKDKHTTEHRISFLVPEEQWPGTPTPVEILRVEIPDCGSREAQEFVAGLAVALRLSGADFAALMPTIRAALDAVKQAADVFPEEVPQ